MRSSGLVSLPSSLLALQRQGHFHLESRIPILAISQSLIGRRQLADGAPVCEFSKQAVNAATYRNTSVIPGPFWLE